MKKTVLIVKLGYSETLVNEDGFLPSLGDVFRHTVLLHHYSKHRVTWLTSESAAPLLRNNPLIHELVIFAPKTQQELSKRTFDEVLCLEKGKTLCSLARSIRATTHCGFDWKQNASHAHPGAEGAMDIVNGKDHFLPIQAILLQMVGDYWNGENYILGYKPRPRETFDVGFNFRVGRKWPSKRWPEKNWRKLAKYCTSHGLSVSMQQGETNLEEYMDWVNAGRAIVTCDSLGMHLGLAMKKKVVALFGPTPSEAIHMYGRGIILTADWACPKAPCMQAQCDNHDRCMSEIHPKVVARTINNLLLSESESSKPPATVPFRPKQQYKTVA